MTQAPINSTPAAIAAEIPTPRTLEEAAAYLGLAPSTLRRKANQGVIGCTRSNGRLFFWPDDLNRYLWDRRS